jgi:hypothetical protein
MIVTPDWRPRSIPVVRLSALGDVVRASGVLAALRSWAPQDVGGRRDPRRRAIDTVRQAGRAACAEPFRPAVPRPILRLREGAASAGRRKGGRGMSGGPSVDCGSLRRA